MADPESKLERFRAALLLLDAGSLRDAIRGLPKSVSAPLHTAAMTPFPALGRLPDPAAALRRVRDIPLLTAVADACVGPCLAATLEVLGDTADDPSIDDLRAALPTISERFPPPVVRLMFATVAISDAVAADRCDELLGELPEAEPSAAPPAPFDAARKAPPPTAADDQVREARRARRREQQDARRKQQEARARGEQARRDAKRARPSPPATDAGGGAAPIVGEVSRRAPALSPEQAKEFDPTDELVGAVVIALVPFEGEGPAQPGPQQKTRPCVVIAASASDLLVRPCYSGGGVQSKRWQSHPLRGWVAAGLDRATWVEDVARVVARADAGDPLGRVTPEDWNALW